VAYLHTYSAEKVCKRKRGTCTINYKVLVMFGDFHCFWSCYLCRACAMLQDNLWDLPISSVERQVKYINKESGWGALVLPTQ
jgi:hypothetical protein